MRNKLGNVYWYYTQPKQRTEIDTLIMNKSSNPNVYNPTVVICFLSFEKVEVPIPTLCKEEGNTSSAIDICQLKKVVRLFLRNLDLSVIFFEQLWHLPIWMHILLVNLKFCIYETIIQGLVEIVIFFPQCWYSCWNPMKNPEFKNWYPRGFILERHV